MFCYSSWCPSVYSVYCQVRFSSCALNRDASYICKGGGVAVGVFMYMTACHHCEAPHGLIMVVCMYELPFNLSFVLWLIFVYYYFKLNSLNVEFTYFLIEEKSDYVLSGNVMSYFLKIFYIFLEPSRSSKGSAPVATVMLRQVINILLCH